MLAERSSLLGESSSDVQCLHTEGREAEDGRRGGCVATLHNLVVNTWSQVDVKASVYAQPRSLLNLTQCIVCMHPLDTASITVMHSMDSSYMSYTHNIHYSTTPWIEWYHRWQVPSDMVCITAGTPWTCSAVGYTPWTNKIEETFDITFHFLLWNFVLCLSTYPLHFATVT